MTKLQIRHELFVPREIVYELWTDPAHLESWYAHGPIAEPAFRAEPQAGGRYDFAWRDDSGSEHAESGEYTTVEKPSCLSYTASFAGSAEPAEHEVTVTFEDLGGATRISIEETGFASDAACSERETIWHMRLADLEDYLSSI